MSCIRDRASARYSGCRRPSNGRASSACAAVGVADLLLDVMERNCPLAFRFDSGRPTRVIPDVVAAPFRYCTYNRTRSHNPSSASGRFQAFDGGANEVATTKSPTQPAAQTPPAAAAMALKGTQVVDISNFLAAPMCS